MLLAGECSTYAVWLFTRAGRDDPGCYLTYIPCTIGFDFAYDGGGAGKGGTGTLSVNGSKVAEGRIEKTVPVVFSTEDTFDVGVDWGTPVSPTYQPPFKFTGTLNQVTVEVT